jgi:5-oxoprolinase (ATP-hydrolysing)
MALADRVFEAQEPASDTWGGEGVLSSLQRRVEALEKHVRETLQKDGFEGKRLETEVLLNLRYEGTDTALMTLKPPDSWDVDKAFVSTYKQEVRRASCLSSDLC